VGESGTIKAATEGATAPETLRSTDRLKDKTLESGPLGERSRRRSKSLRPKRTAGGTRNAKNRSSGTILVKRRNRKIAGKC